MENVQTSLVAATAFKNTNVVPLTSQPSASPVIDVRGATIRFGGRPASPQQASEAH